jgi:hypothetical protein
MRNLLDGLAATAVIVALGATPAGAQSAGTGTASPCPSHLVGRWVRNARGTIVGSVWAVKGPTVVMLVGPLEGFVQGNRLVSVPLSEVSQTASGVILSNAGVAALGIGQRVG